MSQPTLILADIPSQMQDSTLAFIKLHLVSCCPALQSVQDFQVLASFIFISKRPPLTFYPPQHVNRTLNKSPSCLDTNCPRKRSSNQSRKLLLFTGFSSGSSSPTRGLHSPLDFCSRLLERAFVLIVLFHTLSNLFFSLYSERCLEPQQ